MTPNGTAIQALRQVQSLSLRRLARMAKTSASQLSRIERGRAGAGDDLIYRLAKALDVPVDDITRGEVVSTKELAPVGADEKSPNGMTKKKPVERVVPYPGTPEGAVFHYTPEEAAGFLPWSALQLKRKAYAREIPFNDGGARVTFTGLDIREISQMTAVRPLAETVPVQKRAS
ncbi:helix-turn-helix domain-containing protein [Streptomyces sp. A5-4]|uniref:helix-turn-helix domain-containing protein n=1 Tax=Streptomyces sp. A5-4 TaxID=3384771 RepID=UPI003DA7AE56